MQNSSQPKLLPVPFADAGSKQDIPNDSQIGVTAGRASYTDGFPPLTRTPLAAGGVPPFGTDFNGVLNDITAAVRWSQSGAGYPFNAAFNTAIGGYPKGARIPNSTLDGFWLNNTDGNSVNPENTTSALTGWVPSGFYGTTSITGLSGSSVTLTTLQAGRDRITLAGTLTANINLTVPAWVKRWEIINNCTGSFSVTVKTPSGNGVSVAAGSIALVQGDGTNINLAASPGSLLNVQVFTASGTYTPTAGTKKIKVRMVGAGGAGGGTAVTSATQIAAAFGGNAGSYAESKFIDVSAVASVAVTVGSAGVAAAGATGGNGGTSTFGSYLTAPGGAGGAAGPAGSGLSMASDNSAGTASFGTALLFGDSGRPGGGPISISADVGSQSNFKSGKGADSIFGGAGGGKIGGGSARAANGYGAGGGGQSVGPSATTTSAGGNGSGGLVIVEEYA